jgi:aryl-alcohol dehydrogenase-like predicted oxidoreductase
MLHRRIARVRYVEVAGTRVSVIGLGTWQFGSAAWGYGESYATSTAGRLVRRALDLGVTLVDTAEIDAFGRAERIVGAAVADRPEEAFLATKLYPALPVAPLTVRSGRASARRLGVDVIDLYQLHAANPIVPIAQAMRGMRRLQGDGVVRHVGISNLGLEGWLTAERSLGGPVLSNQVRYSLAVRAAEDELVPYAQANDRLVIAYSPLGQGLLSGRFSAASSVPRDVRAGNPLFSEENLTRARPLLGALGEVARTHAVTSATVALAWLIRRPNVVAIPGARTLAQLEHNVAAADLELSDDEDMALTEASDEAGLVVPRRGLVRRLTGRPAPT